MKWIILILALAANLLAAMIIRGDYGFENGPWTLPPPWPWHAAPMDLGKPLPPYIQPLWKHPHSMAPLAVAAALSAACAVLFLRARGGVLRLAPAMLNVAAFGFCLWLVIDYPREYRRWYREHATAALPDLGIISPDTAQ